MAVTTRSSARLSRTGGSREHGEALETCSTSTKRARRCSDQPRTKRRRSSSSILAKQAPFGDAERQTRVALTWQQRDLLQQERPARRPSQSKRSHHQSGSLGKALPLEEHADAPERSASRTYAPDSRLEPWTSNTPSDAYAEPSCFRAPLPHCLPHPTFSRPTASIRALATAPA
ncbi:hypothetical protein PaG_03126 [Moesziomyces aphidis]|uniref:Uncharacterized protein n=1 Tax=Moesziomyces aphidis TaxID=84754 RepID=W3VLF8_MOEAP|nr:hypothetical protein PaG_03126 [Moesziomyces aphidis]